MMTGRKVPNPGCISVAKYRYRLRGCAQLTVQDCNACQLADSADVGFGISHGQHEILPSEMAVAATIRLCKLCALSHDDLVLVVEEVCGFEGVGD
jgi:hypothetical protein